MNLLRIKTSAGCIACFLAGPIAALLLPVSCRAQTYNISTFAGGGSCAEGLSDDGSPAKGACVFEPWDLALDSFGNVYVAAQTVRKIDSNGIIRTVAGGGEGPGSGDGGPATQASLDPTAVAIDLSGNLLIADAGRSSIRRVDAHGIITTIAGNGFEGNTGDGGPATAAEIGQILGLATDRSGNIYFVGIEKRLRKIDTNGVITTIAGQGTSSSDGIPAANAVFSYPTGVAVDADGNIYVADGDRVREINAAGMMTTVAGSTNATYSGDGGPATKAGIDSAWHVAVDSAGALYITERSDPFGQPGNYIRRVSPDGTISTIAGTSQRGFSGDGGPATSAALDLPEGIAVSPSGLIYFADSQNSLVRLLTPAGPPPGAPAIIAGGIVPVYSSTPIIQPGSWVSIFGTNLATATYTWNSDFPTKLGNTTVTIDGKPAYLWYVSPGQINLQAPDDTALGSVSVVVTTPAGTGTSTVTLATVAPSFNLLDGKHVAGIILRSDGSGAYGGGAYDIVGPTGTSLGYETVAAKAGDVLELFGVGFGPTSPTVPAGKPYSGAAATTDSVQLLVNNIPVPVTFSGLTSAGLYQLNVQLLSGLGTGDVQLLARVGGVQTPSAVVLSLQ